MVRNETHTWLRRKAEQRHQPTKTHTHLSDYPQKEENEGSQSGLKCLLQCHTFKNSLIILYMYAMYFDHFHFHFNPFQMVPVNHPLSLVSAASMGMDVVSSSRGWKPVSDNTTEVNELSIPEWPSPASSSSVRVGPSQTLPPSTLNC